MTKKANVRGFTLERKAFALVELPAVSRRQRAAFTLVELLVVIGIIAVLVSVLLPAIARVRVQAETLKCASNLRQIGIGFTMYRNAWNNNLPPVDAYGSHVGVGKPWRFTKDYMMYSSIGPYLGKPAARNNVDNTFSWGYIQYNAAKVAAVGGPGDDFVFQPQKGAIKGTVWECPDPKESRYDYPSMRGYSESMFLIEPATIPNTALPRPFAKIKYPSTAVHVSDAYYAGGGVGQIKTLGDDASDVKLGTNTGFDLRRHNRDKGANILFADGHVQYYDRADVRKNLTYDAIKPTSMTLNWRLP